jgi:hypothetical protein
MSHQLAGSIRRWSVKWHRDLGYFFSSLIIIYCISGLALNHVNDWDPDFIIERQTVRLPAGLTRDAVGNVTIADFSQRVGQTSYKVYDFPTANQVKIYYEDATLHVNLETGLGDYEQLTKRPVFYQSNVLHRNSLTGWKWVSDIFAVMLILITVTGLIILKGRYGFRRRGIFIMLAGFMLPVIALILFYFLTSGN